MVSAGTDQSASSEPALAEDNVYEAHPSEGRLTEADYMLLDRFLGCVLDRYKDGSIDKNDALDDIAYLIAAVDVPGGYNWSAFMLSVIEDLDG
jgi:hypothetical protein